MRIQTKQTSYTVTLILLLSISTFAILMPTAQAHTPAWNIPTWTYLSVSPSPIGVNQQLFIIMWLNLPPPTAYGLYGDRWEGLKVTVTKPDGTTQTLGPFKSDPVGTAYTTYTPDQTGKYTFQSSFPGQTLAGNNPPLYPARQCLGWRHLSSQLKQKNRSHSNKHSTTTMAGNPASNRILDSSNKRNEQTMVFNCGRLARRRRRKRQSDKPRT